MSFLEADSWRLPISIAEILLPLLLSAVIGWLIVKAIMASRLRALRDLIAERKTELAACWETTVDSKSETTNGNLMPAYNIPNGTTSPEDLKIILGIGPKTEELLNHAGIFTYLHLSEAHQSKLIAILTKAGPRFQIQDSSAWPYQATLAHTARWDELEALKMELISGRTDLQIDLPGETA